MFDVLYMRRRECARRIDKEFVGGLSEIKKSFVDILTKKENLLLSIIIFLLKRITKN